ncbi:MAG: WXG100 family type VII secretion target [Patescibacteria group bacterium]|nr:WXG100 family type VII secretion target [Patescibacteria group bacterium]
MAQAIVDPGDLRRFARTLKKFNTDIQDRLAVMGAELAALGKTWRDQEHQKFADEFEQHLKVISRFTEVTEQHIPYLLRKAELIEDYLQQR